MSADPEQLAALRIVEAIRAAFPAEAAEIDELLARDGYENAPHTWVERFSQFTTDAIKRGEVTTASAHLNLLSRLLAQGNDFTLRCIDVAYVESLMWDVEDEKLKKSGWKLVPANLRALYVEMWGERPFMKGVK
ncbi:hypothetical protein HZ992_14855 [Rhizobacter sp. AJA081-3]|uniref:DUF7674 family protein n=1 Tax=Rhizobacter sp. AJA081-3 TaxID=2753607 RepID=UPI001ADF5CF1|nr:hypothetical protein [Rhizobacter sp. AJA081-3]QTN21464.1 hypothetical protein HZ992_14855 [Rhizobacter sp. AJA081-3]